MVGGGTAVRFGVLVAAAAGRWIGAPSLRPSALTVGLTHVAAGIATLESVVTADPALEGPGTSQSATPSTPTVASSPRGGGGREQDEHTEDGLTPVASPPARSPGPWPDHFPSRSRRSDPRTARPGS
ncbi:hypothetical protein [Haloplanus salinarum]|uniref:hypothetical protein n=1 Tax=Haloplanus salinarum TaxID=1912324 RepID=UPI00214C84A5|nr:hypothetical protein [Haloplanus salinarum]